MAPLAAILIDRKRDDKFRSTTPRLLHLCAGQPLWRWAQAAVEAAGAEKIVLLGDSAGLAALKASVPVAATFEEALRLLGPASGYFVAYADAALMHPEDLSALAAEGADAGEPRVPDMDDGDVEAAYAFVPGAARKFLTGAPGKDLLPVKAGKAKVDADPYEASLRVLDRRDLSDAETWLRDRIIYHHQMEGVTFVDPASCFVDAQVRIGRDTVVHPFTTLSGATVIEKKVQVGPFARIHDSRLDEGCVVEQSVLDQAHVRAGATVGPWTRLRPGADIGEGAHAGSFVEIKNSSLGKGAKAGHLAYLGDAQVGDGANIGAGTITANNDGKHKHPTKIGKRAFIGSGTVLVAPVEVGDNAVTGAGAVVLKGRNVPKGATVAGVPARAIKQGAKP